MSEEQKKSCQTCYYNDRVQGMSDPCFSCINRCYMFHIPDEPLLEEHSFWLSDKLTEVEVRAIEEKELKEMDELLNKCLELLDDK